MLQFRVILHVHSCFRMRYRKLIGGALCARSGRIVLGAMLEEGRAVSRLFPWRHPWVNICVSFFSWRGGQGASSNPLAGNVTLCAGVLELGGSTGLLVSPVSVHACTESPSVHPGPPTATCPNGLATELAQGLSIPGGWGELSDWLGVGPGSLNLLPAYFQTIFLLHFFTFPAVPQPQFQRLFRFYCKCTFFSNPLYSPRYYDLPAPRLVISICFLPLFCSKLQRSFSFIEDEVCISTPPAPPLQFGVNLK